MKRVSVFRTKNFNEWIKSFFTWLSLKIKYNKNKIITNNSVCVCVRRLHPLNGKHHTNGSASMKRSKAETVCSDEDEDEGVKTILLSDTTEEDGVNSDPAAGEEPSALWPRHRHALLNLEVRGRSLNLFFCLRVRGQWWGHRDVQRWRERPPCGGGGGASGWWKSGNGSGAVGFFWR